MWALCFVQVMGETPQRVVFHKPQRDSDFAEAAPVSRALKRKDALNLLWGHHTNLDEEVAYMLRDETPPHIVMQS
jgi:hypothetical protein